MCGIAGVLALNTDIDNSVLHEMSKIMRHRGPDDSGYLLVYWSGRRYRVVRASDEDTVEEYRLRDVNVLDVDRGWRLALINRRLAILDPSPRGHQPMSNEDETIWVVYNGEVYNFKELGEELRRKGHELRCNCDTEVIIHGYEEWGIKGLLRRLRGMWAFALLDSRNGKLYLSRDYFGIKPLYYIRGASFTAFASEIKVFAPIVKLEPRMENVTRFLLYKPLPPNETFFENVYKLPPSTYAEIDLETGKMRLNEYWSPPRRITPTKYEEAVELWRETFLESLRIHLRSDYPISFLLSGGLDSSSLLLGWKHLRENKLLDRWALGDKPPVSLAFSHGGERDETRYAREAAEAAGSQLVIVKPGVDEIAEELERIVYFHDEPPYGSSIIAEWFVLREASRYSKVVISGQGGDEILAGYHRYIYYYILWLLRKGKLLRALKEAWAFRDLIRERSTHYWFRRRLEKIAKKLGVKSTSYSRIKECTLDFINCMLLRDIFSEKLERLLHNLDRDSMAHSIEARVPFLDVKLVELSLQLPGSYKLSNGWTKRIHRDALRGILPDSIRLRRSKVGFEAPAREWIVKLTERGYLEWNTILEKLKEHGVHPEILRLVESLVAKLPRGSLTTAEADYLWRIVFLYYWLRLVEKGFRA